MHRALLTSLLTIILLGCTTTSEQLVGEPVYFKYINDDIFWENIIVYGRLQKEILREPTQVYGSSFGHAYCMAEEVTFEVLDYIQWSGPDLIKFTQNKIDFCRPLAENIGFGESILFLSKNRYRGVWSTGSIKISEIDGESRIFRPSDIIYFISFNDFESLLSEYEKPFEWGMEKSIESEDVLATLKEKGVLSYKLDSSDKNNDFYLIAMYKYINLDRLLNIDF